MPARHCRLGRHLAVAAAFLVVACNDSTGPQGHLSDPQALSIDLLAVASVLQSPTFQSFSVLGRVTGSPVAAPGRAAALLRAAPIVPPRTPAPAYAQAPARAWALRDAATLLSSGISASVIADTLLGKTFVWDTATHGYVEDTTSAPPAPAPANGVRIILYQVDPSGNVIEPTVAVGFVDLLDESSGNTNALHVIVKGGDPTAPGTTYANYTISATVTGVPPNAFTATGNGFVSDGTRTLTFAATLAVTHLETDNPDIQIDVTWDLDNPAVHVELHETLATASANQLTLTTQFSVTRGAETVSAHGTISLVVSPLTETVNLTIDVNGVPWARITGTNDGITVRHADGSTLSSAELEALSDLFGLPDQVELVILSLFTPAQSLLGA